MAFEKRSVISQVFGVTGRACGLFLVVGTVFGTAGWFSDGLVLVVGSLGLGFVVLGGGGLVRLTRAARRQVHLRETGTARGAPDAGAGSDECKVQQPQAVADPLAG